AEVRASNFAHPTSGPPFLQRAVPSPAGTPRASLGFTKNQAQPACKEDQKGMENTTDRLYRMPIGDFLRRRPEAQTCQACGSPLPHGAVFCPSCGVRTDDPHAEPLHIV